MPIITKALTLEDLPPPPLGKTGWPWTEQSEPLPIGCQTFMNGPALVL